MKRQFMVPVLVGALLLTGCLPGDTRPTPGHVFLTAAPSVATTEGVSTVDGWTIQFERLLAGLGHVTLVGDECNSYSGAHYDRFFDFTVPGAAKLGEAYGLGTCDVRFALSSPSKDALLEKGVSASDLDLMWAPLLWGDPPQPVPGARIFKTVYARGVAKRGGETKRFEWRFSGFFFLNDCTSGPNATPTNAVHLSGGDDEHLELTFHGEELFRASTEDNAALRFDLLADADANSDGNITLEELGSVPAPAAETDAGVEEDAGAADGGIWNLPGLAGFLERQLLPRMVHLDQGTCKALAPRRDR